MTQDNKDTQLVGLIKEHQSTKTHLVHLDIQRDRWIEQFKKLCKVVYFVGSVTVKDGHLTERHTGDGLPYPSEPEFVELLSDIETTEQRLQYLKKQLGNLGIDL